MAWVEGQPARIVEHDPDTRQPKPGGQVIPVTILGVADYVHVYRADGSRDYFLASTGWRAWDDTFCWRLLAGAGPSDD